MWFGFVLLILNKLINIVFGLFYIFFFLNARRAPTAHKCHVAFLMFSIKIFIIMTYTRKNVVKWNWNPSGKAGNHLSKGYFYSSCFKYPHQSVLREKNPLHFLSGERTRKCKVCQSVNPLLVMIIWDFCSISGNFCLL